MPKRFVNRPIPIEAAARVASRFTETADGCWITLYAVGPSGYAMGSWQADGTTRMSGVHRIAWAHHRGPIPDGMTVHHKCFNRTCVNPLHLDLMSNVENARRQRGSDWSETSCEYGHAESDRKLYGKKKPVWRCGECVRIRNAMLTERAKQQRAARKAA